MSKKFDRWSDVRIPDLDGYPEDSDYYLLVISTSSGLALEIGWWPYAWARKRWQSTTCEDIEDPVLAYIQLPDLIETRESEGRFLDYIERRRSEG